MKQQYQYMQGSKNSRPGGWIQGVSADIFYISLIFHGSRGGPSILPVVRMVVLFDYWIFHNRSSKIIGQEVSIDD